MRILTASDGRKKLWEIPDYYLCSVVGTCLTLDETRMILRKRGIVIPKALPDYKIHAIAVNSSGSVSDISRTMHKVLDRKYQAVLSFFNLALEEGEIDRLWDIYRDRGEIPGAYWAVMTHPASATELLDRAFGEVHMLSHIQGSSRVADIVKLGTLEERNRELERKNIMLRRELAEAGAARQDAENNNAYLREIERERDILKQRISCFENGSEHKTLREELLQLVNVLEMENNARERIAKRLEEAEERIKELEEHTGSLEFELENKNREIVTMETALSSILSCDRMPGECGDPASCPRVSLSGRKILYVGGRPHVVHRCAEMVRFWGGEFNHHDGGIEDNFGRLAAAVSGADAVFCPLDCVSHNACSYVKKIAGRYGKPVTFLPNAGLSSFIREVTGGEGSPINGIN